VATPEEIKRAKELEAIERSRRDIAREMQGISASQAYTRDSVSQAASLTDYARMLTEEMKEQAGITRGRSEVDKSLLSISQQLQQSAQKVTSEIGNEYRVQQQISRDRELQRKIQIEIANAQSALDNERIEKARRISEISLIEQRTQALSQQITAKIVGNQSRLNQLKSQGGHLYDKDIKKLTESLEIDKRKVESLEKILQTKREELDEEKNTATESERKLATLNSQQDVITDILGIRQAELQTQRKITQATGVTGAVVGGLGGIMQRLGMRSGIFNQAMDDSKEAMEAMAGEAEKAGKSVSKLAVAMKGVGILADAAAKVLTDPAVVIGAIVDGFFDLNKAGVEFGQMTGQAADAMHGVNTEVATAVDMLKTATSVTKELGLNAAAVFTPQQIGQISDMATLLGLSEQAAGRLGLMMKTTGQSADQLGESVYETVSGLNEAGRSAVAPRQVLDDVLTASEDIALSLGNNPKQLAAAATAARAFGMTLSQVDKIADSLLDFESSIEAELEAQLLTGKNINMAKARELALNNDLAGLAKELEKQGVSAVEFSKMNRIQQEATAKALGMSRQELSKSLLTQEAQANMTEEQLAAARGVSLEESKRISIQERIQKQLEKLQLAFAPVLEALVPIVEMLSNMLNPVLAGVGWVGKLLAGFIKLTPVMLTLKGLVLAAFGKKLVDMIFLQGKSMKSLLAVQKAFNLAKSHEFNLNKAGKLDGRLAQAKAMKNLTLGQTIALKAHNAATAVGNAIRKASLAVYNALFSAETRQTIAKKAGFLMDRLRNSETLKFIVNKGRELAAYIAAKVPIVADTAAKLLNFKATAAVNTANTVAGPAAAGAASGFAAAGVGLGAFGTAAAPAIPIILAIGGALLMASPAIYALGLMITGLAQVIGNVLMKALEMLPSIIASVATGFTMILSQVTLEKAAALVVMGAGFAAIGYGLTLLSASLLTALPGLVMLGAIAALGPGLALAGSGVKLIADNVSKLSEALQTLNLENLDRLEEFMTKSALTMPIIAAAGPAAASAISTIAGAGGDGEEDNKVAAKIQELIDLVGSGQIVELKLDSDTITKQQMISLSKQR